MKLNLIITTSDVFSLKNNQVFDTCLKSDEQHDVAGQKINHGGYIPCH